MPFYRQKDKEDQGEGKASGSKAQACLCRMDSDMLFSRPKLIYLLFCLCAYITEIGGGRDVMFRLAGMKR